MIADNCQLSVGPGRAFCPNLFFKAEKAKSQSALCGKASSLKRLRFPRRMFFAKKIIKQLSIINNSTYFCGLYWQSGLTGFDRRRVWICSMQAHGMRALKDSSNNLIGETNYAMAA